MGLLRTAGARGALRRFPVPVPTAAAAAQALDCEIGAIANSLVFAADGEPLLVLASGAHRVERARLARLVGAEGVRRASPELVLAATGQRVGGVAPIGHPRPLRTVVDTWLGRYRQVWAGAGNEHTMFATSFSELVRLTGGLAAEVGPACEFGPAG